jgi:hypothetical protein
VGNACNNASLKNILIFIKRKSHVHPNQKRIIGETAAIGTPAKRFYQCKELG